MLDAKKITFNSIKLVIIEIAYSLILTFINVGKQVLNTIITQYGATSEIQRLKGETENAKAEARKTVETQQILAQTSNIELARKQREQEIANLKLKGEAEAEAIKIRAKALDNIALPKVVTSNDLKVLGIDSLIREATDSSR